MRIAMIGTGYVGLVSGACFSDFGHEVVCVDTDNAKIAQLQAGAIPIFEPGLDMLVARNVEAGRLSFSTDLGAAVRSADAVFLAVGTPSRRNSGLETTTKSASGRRFRMIASISSWVPPGTVDLVATTVKSAIWSATASAAA